MDAESIASIRRTGMCPAYLVLSFFSFLAEALTFFSSNQTHVTPCHVYLDEHITISIPQLGCVFLPRFLTNWCLLEIPLNRRFKSRRFEMLLRQAFARLYFVSMTDHSFTQSHMTYFWVNYTGVGSRLLLDH